MYPVMPANNVVPKTAISGAVDPRKPIPSNPPIDFNSLILKATEEGFEKREKEQQAILQQEKEWAFEEMVAKQEKCVFDSDERQVWSGFLTKNGKNRVGVDAYLLSGKFPDETISFNLNISHRAKTDEVLRHMPLW